MSDSTSDRRQRIQRRSEEKSAAQEFRDKYGDRQIVTDALAPLLEMGFEERSGSIEKGNLSRVDCGRVTVRARVSDSSVAWPFVKYTAEIEGGCYEADEEYASVRAFETAAEYRSSEHMAVLTKLTQNLLERAHVMHAALEKVAVDFQSELKALGLTLAYRVHKSDFAFYLPDDPSESTILSLYYEDGTIYVSSDSDYEDIESYPERVDMSAVLNALHIIYRAEMPKPRKARRRVRDKECKVSAESETVQFFKHKAVIDRVPLYSEGVEKYITSVHTFDLSLAMHMALNFGCIELKRSVTAISQVSSITRVQELVSTTAHEKVVWQVIVGNEVPQAFLDIIDVTKYVPETDGE